MPSRTLRSIPEAEFSKGAYGSRKGESVEPSFDCDSAPAKFHYGIHRFDAARREVGFDCSSAGAWHSGPFGALRRMAQSEDTNSPFVSLFRPLARQGTNQVRVEAYVWLSP